MRLLLGTCLLFTLASCQSRPPTDASVQPPNTDITVTGILEPEESEIFTVPGGEGNARVIESVVPNGSRVAAGEVIAIFSQAEDMNEVAATEAELEKIDLAGKDKISELDKNKDDLRVAIAGNEGELRVAERYAGSAPYAVARNTVLDAIQDKNYLRERLTIKRWQLGQYEQRRRAESEVIVQQKATVDRNLVAGKELL